MCSFDRLDGVIENQCKSSFLTGIISRVCENFGGAELSKVKPGEWATNVHTPVMVVHGTEDSLISLDSGKNLYRAYASENKRWVEVAGATHQNILVTEMPLYADMSEWILSF